MKRLTLFLSLLLTYTLSVATFHVPINALHPTSATYHDSVLAECTFFGDSTTYGLFRFNAHNDKAFGKNYYTLQDTQIWTPSNGTFYLGNILNATVNIQKQEYSLSEAAQKFKPQRFIITVGINGLASWNKESFCRYYNRLIAMIQNASPTTVIYLQSVYPIAPKALEKLPKFSNQKIDTVNTWICEMASEHRISYLNTASVLKDAHGNLNENFHNGDGLHLSCEGFNTMLRYVENQLMKELI